MQVIPVHTGHEKPTEWLEFGCRGKFVRPAFKQAFNLFADLVELGNNADRLLYLSSHGLSVHGLYGPVSKLNLVNSSDEPTEQMLGEFMAAKGIDREEAQRRATMAGLLLMKQCGWAYDPCEALDSASDRRRA